MSFVLCAQEGHWSREVLQSLSLVLRQTQESQSDGPAGTPGRAGSVGPSQAAARQHTVSLCGGECPSLCRPSSILRA